VLALGLMSGTSADGVDAALLRTDGEAVVVPGAWLTEPYPAELRAALRAARRQKKAAPLDDLARRLTLAHVAAVRRLLAEAAVPAGAVAVLGFHGHTVRHEPARRRTVQIGDGALLARATGIDVVCDFRSADVAAGGQGAPLAPLYHAARARTLARPLAVLNLGGVANVTWLGQGAGDILAFDTGPANALLDDWAAAHTGAPVDRDGALARAGRVDAQVLARLLEDRYFALPPPKSLDRDHFAARARALLAGLAAADGAATLAAFTAAAAAGAARHFPAPARRWLVCGGGRHNPALMAALAARLGAAVAPVEAVGWQGDALEAQAFAYLAVRSLRALPLSLPSTTGVPAPTRGGVLVRARDVA